MAADAEFKDGKAYIRLENGEGLICHYPTVVDVFVADDSGEFKKADLEFSDNLLVLSSPEVKQPTMARYAFDQTYLGRHVHNGAGLPLAPFRTDGPFFNMG